MRSPARCNHATPKRQREPHHSGACGRDSPRESTQETVLIACPRALPVRGKLHLSAPGCTEPVTTPAAKAHHKCTRPKHVHWQHPHPQVAPGSATNRLGRCTGVLGAWKGGSAAKHGPPALQAGARPQQLLSRALTRARGREMVHASPHRRHALPRALGPSPCFKGPTGVQQGATDPFTTPEASPAARGRITLGARRGAGRARACGKLPWGVRGGTWECAGGRGGDL